MKRVSCTLRNDLKELARIVKLVEAFCKANNLSEKVNFELNLIVEELFVNIISYGYDDKLSHEIKIEMELKGKELKVFFIDDGKLFDPLKYPTPDLKKVLDRAKGGLGIYLVRQMADKLNYKRKGSFNHLVVFKMVS